ncbi:MAG: 30S ribosomal protein S16 [Hyphomicrobiaceae bacterium]|nr:30S ribosomal protein S16 [Hyphomicrobiaceae bacterium]
MSIVKLRLTRAGSKKRPYYHIVAAPNTSPRDGRYIERIGSYNPMIAKDHPDRVKLKEERCKHWLSTGAQPTDRVSRFFEAVGLLVAKNRNNPKKALPGKRRQEREAAAT